MASSIAVTPMAMAARLRKRSLSARPSVASRIASAASAASGASRAMPLSSGPMIGDREEWPWYFARGLGCAPQRNDVAARGFRRLDGEPSDQRAQLLDSRRELLGSSG